MGSSKRKRKSESESNMSGTGDPSANLYSLDGKRINTGTGDRECKRFDRLSLSPMLLNGVKDLGYEKMTLVQEATLPAILQGKDVLAKAKTGMEKTLAFSVIVATPTRLWDHIENTRGFEGRLRDVNVLVLHEADCLLAMHIRKDVEKIIAAVHQFCHNTLRKDHEFIDIVQESSEETHSQAQQMHLIAPLDKRFSLLYILLQEHIVNDVDYKAIVFCTTTAVTRLVAEFLCKLNMNVGAPSNRAQYIHRLGGTGHDGKKAQGMLLLAPWEGFFLSSIKDLAIAEAPLPLVDPGGGGAFRHREEDQRVGLYVACFRYYSRIKKVGEDKHRLVELANDLSRSIGLYNLPEIPTRILNEMGLMNSPAVRATLDHNWIFT
ncbi:hypothetical protein GOBAR_DD10481 [Gossypium barbadense]|nr:hypothetical protein GOBAR_DD10481 [Gossypium barbadense]